MRKSILILLAGFFSIASYAQVQFGLKGGLNFATVRYISTDNSKARVGWNAGLLSEIPIQENLLIRPELLYSSKGFGFSAMGTNSAGAVKLNYMAVPVLFGYRPTASSALFLGPEFGYLTKAVSKSSGISTDMTGTFRHFDMGFDIGAAYTISKGFGIEARYNHGFKDLVNVVYMNNNEDISGQGKDGANSVLQVGIFYMFTQ